MYNKYSRLTEIHRQHPRVWLNDYRLACQLGGATSDEVIIRNLPLHLGDAARMWLEHLPASQIHIWDDLVRTFVGNFQGTYVRPGNSWDLRSCTQKPGESLRDFIRQEGQALGRRARGGQQVQGAPPEGQAGQEREEAAP
jgi:hypothetical protein